MVSQAICLNAPFGAWCFLTNKEKCMINIDFSLNAPFGARCFLTRCSSWVMPLRLSSLNASYCARCFLTQIVEDGRMICFAAS